MNRGSDDILRSMKHSVPLFRGQRVTVEDHEINRGSNNDILVLILKYNYLFWLFTVFPFKIDLKSFPRSAFVFINAPRKRFQIYFKWDDGE